ncbi:MAG: 2-dehydro-3-deoxy-6-phosphogalactonate aldolase [Asticcacaulis sp.]
MLKAAMEAMPLIAILRGVKPEEVGAIGRVLYESGLRCIEVPLNSPNPFESIRILAESMPRDCLVGAGTVTNAEDVERVRAAKGRLIVTPNTDTDVIRAAVAADMYVTPGFATASDAFAAIKAGATYLKLFPASSYGTQHLRALSAVLPKTCKVLAVGGIAGEGIEAWKKAGAIGFGMASDLYQPGDSVEDVQRKSAAICTALRAK